MPDLLASQPCIIVITRFFSVLHFKLLRKIHGTHDKLFGMCASIDDKICNYKALQILYNAKSSVNVMEKIQGKNP